MTNLKTAVILAAGKGIRLDRQDTPKPLVRIGHKPLIMWNIEQLQEAGFGKIYVAVGHKGELIKKELTGHSQLTASVEYISADAAGKDMLQSVVAAGEMLEGPFTLTVSDILVEENPYFLLDDAFLSKKQGIITSVVGTDSGHWGRSGANVRVFLEGNGVRAIGRDLEKYNGLEVGIWHFGEGSWQDFKAVLAEKPHLQRFEEILAHFAARGKLRGSALKSGEWYDINTPATAVRAEIFARRKFYAHPSFPSAVRALAPPEVHAQFSRSKEMQTSIVIKRGILQEIERTLFIPLERIASPHFLLTDSVVDSIYGDAVLNRFRNAGWTMHKLVVPAGEGVKNINTYTALAEEIFAHGLDEGSTLIDIGGGVVNNLAGFLASTLYRGIGLIHIPTTTMAQLDAAIDFKQGVNSKKGKNLLGSFYPASNVIIDPEVLLTTDKRHIVNGLAEAIKHALAQDEGLFRFFSDFHGDIKDLDFLEEATRRTIALKIPLVERGYKDEQGEMAMQYGHSIGHAIEHLSGYELLHGEAVSVGMCVSAEIAKILGIADEAAVSAHYQLLQKYDLPIRVPDGIEAEDVTNSIRYDKHYFGKLPRMGLTEKIGSLWNDRGTYAIPVDYPILERAIKINKNK